MADGAEEIVNPELLIRLLQEAERLQASGGLSGDPVPAVDRIGPARPLSTDTREGLVPLDLRQSQQPGVSPLPNPAVGLPGGALGGTGGEVASLLEPLPEKPETSRVKRTFGKIGDALTAFANIQQGRAAGPGKFATQQARENELFEAQTSAVKARNRAGMVRAGERAEDKKEREIIRAADLAVNKEKTQLKMFDTVDPQGNPISIPIVFDPSTGVIRAATDAAGNQVGGFDKFVKGTALPGIVTDAEGNQSAGFFVLSPNGKFVSRVGVNDEGAILEPQPTSEFTKSIGGRKGLLGGIPGLMERFNIADKSVGGSEGLGNKIQNWFQAQGAKTGFGPIVAPPELVNYFSEVKAVLFPYVQSVSGSAFPEAELQRYESQFPLPGVDTPETAPAKWESLVNLIVRDMRAKYGAAGRVVPASVDGLDIQINRDESGEVDGPGPGDESGVRSRLRKNNADRRGGN